MPVGAHERARGRSWASAGTLVGIRGCPWASVGASVGIHGHPWAPVGIHGNPWASMGTPTDPHGRPQTPTERPRACPWASPHGDALLVSPTSVYHTSSTTTARRSLLLLLALPATVTPPPRDRPHRCRQSQDFKQSVGPKVHKVGDAILGTDPSHQTLRPHEIHDGGIDQRLTMNLTRDVLEQKYFARGTRPAAARKPFGLRVHHRQRASSATSGRRPNSRTATRRDRNNFRWISIVAGTLDHVKKYQDYERVGHTFVYISL